MKQLINPHAHSDYSLDGAAKVKQIIKRNKELGAPYVSLTEHGNLNSAMELYSISKQEGMKPILGIELYVEPPFLPELRSMIEKEIDPDLPLEKKEKYIEQKLKSEYVHLTVHFKDEWAYHYFTSLSPIMESRAVIKFGERKPIATIEEIAKASGHITICSGCVIGMVSKFLLPRKKTKITRPDLAEKAFLLLKEIAGDDNFFVEIMPHEVTHTWQAPSNNQEGRFVKHECTPDNPTGDIQRPVNLQLIQWANKYKVPILVSLDSHYATTDQKIVQDARLGNGQEKWKFYNSYHVMSSQEAFEVLNRQVGVDKKTFEKWIDNSYIWASHFDKFQIKTSQDRWVLPKLPENYQKLLIEKIDLVKRMDWTNPAMVERLKYEIDVLSNNGKVNLLSYFFVVQDIAEFCFQNDILINVRGSAGGSLLLYVLGVSAVNPLKHNLSFERFLTLGRIKANTLPDVDMDVAGQEKVIEYLKNKYQDAFCRISVDVGLKLKSAIKDAERSILGKVREETERLCVTLPKPIQNVSEEQFVFGYEEDGVWHAGIIETYLPLKTYKAKNPEIWKAVEEMIGITRQKSQHACGVVIADQPVQNYVPITQVGDVKVTGFSPKPLEMAGLVKYDILGLNTLKDISACLQIIKNRKGKKIDPFSLPEEKIIFDRLNSGDTATVFQFDTETVRPYLMAIKPQSIDELAAVTALCRPGTLDAPSGVIDNGRQLSLAELYVLRAQGKLETNFVHPELEPILSSTYGVQLYQEQTIQIFKDVVGYSNEQAESVRRGIGKKDAVVLEKCMGDLRNACLSKGWTNEQVDLLIDQIMASSRYSFNKSHAVSYAYVAYACAYLKHYYPVEWWCAFLVNASKDDIKNFYNHYSQYLEFPDINKSGNNFEIIVNSKGEEKLLAPIFVIEGVGNAAVTEIVSKRPYSSFDDFIEKVNLRVVNKKVIYRLILSGILDTLFPTEYTASDKINAFYKIRNKLGFKDDSSEIQNWTQINYLNRLLEKRKIYNLSTEDWSARFVDFIKQLSNDKTFKIDKWTFSSYATLWTVSHPVHTKDQAIAISYAHNLMQDINNPSIKNIAFFAYVTEQKEFRYIKDGTEFTAVKFMVELGQNNLELVKFPEWGKTHHEIVDILEEDLGLFIIQKYWSKKSNEIKWSLSGAYKISI